MSGVIWMRIHRDGRKRLAKLLLIQGISQRQLADAIGWKSHGMIGHLIAGRKNGVTAESAVAIAHVLGVEVEDLFVTGMATVDRQPLRTRRVA